MDSESRENPGADIAHIFVAVDAHCCLLSAMTNFGASGMEPEGVVWFGYPEGTSIAAPKSS